jgi:RNA polymerase sigma factor (sigma-70 family)
MTEIEPTVFIVDDDESVRKSLSRLLKSAGNKVETYSSAIEFLKRNPYEGPACLLLDIRMPELSGLELQEALAKKNHTISIVFITGHGSIPLSVQAMKAGAVDFIEKPFEEQTLLDAVNLAIKKDRSAKQKQADIRKIQKRIESLTRQERKVFTFVVSGLLNKQIASELGISERTVKAHRAQVMRKIQAKSLADLVRLAEKIQDYLSQD